MGNSNSFGTFKAHLFPMTLGHCSECDGTGKRKARCLRKIERDINKWRELPSLLEHALAEPENLERLYKFNEKTDFHFGIVSSEWKNASHLQRNKMVRERIDRIDTLIRTAEVTREALVRNERVELEKLKTCSACKGLPDSSHRGKSVFKSRYNIMKDDRGELVLRGNYSKYNIKDRFSKITIIENENAIILEVKPCDYPIYYERRYNFRYNTLDRFTRVETGQSGMDYDREETNLRKIKLLGVSKHQSDELEKELRKPEYGVNFVTRKADDGVESRRLLQENARVHSVPATPLESILDEAGIPDAGRRRLAAPSVIAAPDTPSVASYALLFSGLLFVGFLLGKCLRKRNCRRGPSIHDDHDDDEGSL